MSSWWAVNRGDTRDQRTVAIFVQGGGGEGEVVSLTGLPQQQPPLESQRWVQTADVCQVLYIHSKQK